MPAWDEAAVDAMARRLRLGVDPRRRRHGAGVMLGAGPGASLEFHDHRGYVAGDDLRHLDWNILARSDQLVLRRYRQETSPRVEVICDLSCSMGAHEAKARLAIGLTALVVHLALAAGTRPRLLLCGATCSNLVCGRDNWQARLRGASFVGSLGLAADPLPQLSPGGERILVSDGLYSAGAATTLRRFVAGAGRVCLIQVLARAEVEPSLRGRLRLMDVEGGESDQFLDDTALSGYRARFARLQEGWVQALAGRGPGLMTCVAEEGLDAAVRRLLGVGLVVAGAA